MTLPSLIVLCADRQKPLQQSSQISLKRLANSTKLTQWRMFTTGMWLDYEKKTWTLIMVCRGVWTNIFQLGGCCPDVSAKLFPVLRHSACCCHRTKCIRDVFLPSLSWLSSATIPCIIGFSKPLWRVPWPKYFSFWLLHNYTASSLNIVQLVRWAIQGICNILR